MPNEEHNFYGENDYRNPDNEILEVNNIPNTIHNEIKEEVTSNFSFEPKKEKKGKNFWWKKLSKKQKTLVIIGIIVWLIIGGVGVFFGIKKLNQNKVTKPVENVIVQEDNYRYENGVLVFLNAEKKEIGKYDCQNKSDKLCYVTYYSNEDEFDLAKKIDQDEKPILVRSAIFNDNYVFVSDIEKETDLGTSLYNIKEQKVEEKYALVKKGADDSFVVKNKDGKYGVIEINDKVKNKIDFKYNYIGYLKNESNFYITVSDKKSMIINDLGESVSKSFNGIVTNLTSNYVKVKLSSGLYEVDNYNGVNVLGTTYDYAELYPDYVALVKDNKLFFQLYDKNKLNEDGILLNNKDYIKTEIYNEKGKLVESKEAFNIEDNNETITVKVIKNQDEKDTITINKTEGLLSKNLKNINYFDGKLYIYKDNSKAELMGTYPCSNKNVLGVGVTTLDNCFIASDTVFEDNDFEVPGTVGAIPIFNERFIFVADNPELVNDDNKTIVLYDLQKNSVLGKYNAVNTYSYTGVNDVSFAKAKELQVIAKNKSNKFGVIKIGTSEVSGHINFNYSEMEALRDYYVAKDANGYLLLSKNNGSSLTSAIPYKIRNYTDKYVKVRNGNNYVIYDYNGKQITTENYRYVELYDEFFAGVDSNNKLGIYNYKYPTTNEIYQVDTTLNLTNYYGNGTRAFKVEISGSNYTVYRGTTSNTYEMLTTGVIAKYED